MNYDSYIESLNSGRNAEFVNEWFTDDCIVDGGGAPMHGRTQFIAFLDMIRDGIREIARPQRIGYGDNVIFAELDVDFVCSKDRPDFPMGPLRAGETLTLRCHVVYTIRDGRVAVMHNMFWQPGYGVTKTGAPAMRTGAKSRRLTPRLDRVPERSSGAARARRDFPVKLTEKSH